MSKLKNLFYLFLFGGALLGIKFGVVNKIFVAYPKDADVWFTSGLLLVVLGVFVTEKYFTRSLDVIVNIITLTVVLLTIDSPHDFRLWSALLTYTIIVGILALISFVLYVEEKDQNLWSQRISGITGNISRFLGSSKMLFSIVFILSIFNYFIFSLENNQNITKEQFAVLLLIIFWGAVLLIEPIDRRLIQPIIDRLQTKVRPRVLGKVVRRISPNIVVSERTAFAPNITAGDLVYIDNIKRSHPPISNGLMYLYSQQTEDKYYDFFYSLFPTPDAISERMYVHALTSDEQLGLSEAISHQELLGNKTNLIGFVHSGSDIDVLKIKMVDGVDERKLLKEGDLVSVGFYGHPTKYQIINVETSNEVVEGANKQGGKLITAQQIGLWKDEAQKFEGSGWVPEINAPVFIESADEEIAPLAGDHYRVGVVPKSKYPIYIDLEESVTHHIAIIGKTGTGKSRMAAKILEKIARAGYKVIIFEVDRRHTQSLTRYIDPTLVEEQDSNAFNLDTATRPIIAVNLQPIVRQGGGTNTVNFSDLAATIIENVIRYQVNHEDQKICIAMEEAYDFIPENSFGQQTFGQPNVSRISQMVLKCRKHNIGFLIITQRTALVTKTILYQCHTIIALQSFDETSRTFMGAYINQKYLDSMSILPRFRAIVVGKGSSCDQPVIVDFFDPSTTAVVNLQPEINTTEEEIYG